MVDSPSTPARPRLALDRARLKDVGALAPALRPAVRFAARNPFLLVGAALVGVAGMVAWRNRDRIAQTAGPMIEDARARGGALMETARTKSEELVEQAKTKGEEMVEQAKATTDAVVAKAKRTRKPKAAAPVTEVH